MDDVAFLNAGGVALHRRDTTPRSPALFRQYLKQPESFLPFMMYLLPRLVVRVGRMTLPEKEPAA